MAPPISRRTVLQGLGTAVALPWLEAMSSRSLYAAPGSDKPPLRMAYVFTPNGAIMSDWTPEQEGRKFELAPTMQPLAHLKDDLLVLSGLTHDKARSNGDGPGDHARCSAAFLTSMQPYKTSGADIRLGISVDQFAAQKVGHLTKLPSLEIGCDRSRMTGRCDSGYSCAYVSNISWKSPNTPVAQEVSPRQVFERLFGDAAKEGDARSRAKRVQYRLSVLDFVLEDARSLQSKLGNSDQRKMEEYFTSVREIEQRIARSEQSNESTAPVAAQGLQFPDSAPKEFSEHVRLMCDLLVLAFQADVTRISTFMLARAGSNRSYPWLDVPEGHHTLSHHGKNPDKVAKLKKIDRFHLEQYAYLLNRLKSIPEGDGTLLDNCMVLYGSGISDSDRHSHHDLPAILAGKGGGRDTGRHLRFAKETPWRISSCRCSMCSARQPRPSCDSTGYLDGAFLIGTSPAA